MFVVKGEFEKRLKKGLPDYFEQTSNDNFITRMLVEAQKEFEAITSRGAEEHGYKMEKWYYKWFGNAE